jgi:chromosome transmission fidelity protein 1
VLFDEAHNIMETISAMSNITLCLANFTQAHTQLLAYLQKYEKRLLAKNVMFLRDIASLCHKVAGYFKEKASTDK